MARNKRIKTAINHVKDHPRNEEPPIRHKSPHDQNHIDENGQQIGAHDDGDSRDVMVEVVGGDDAHVLDVLDAQLAQHFFEGVVVARDEDGVVDAQGDLGRD